MQVARAVVARLRLKLALACVTGISNTGGKSGGGSFEIEIDHRGAYKARPPCGKSGGGSFEIEIPQRYQLFT